MKQHHLLAALLALSLAAACRSGYYATMERFGVHKRDILVERVQEGRQEQAEAQQQFQTTFERFKELTGAEGGELERVYDRLRKELTLCEDDAEDVREHIDSIEDVAGDLFDEWEGELDEITNRELRAKSRQQLEDTRTRYRALLGTMRSAEARMEPVLVAFRDHVLFLKHNLNARAIASLESTVVAIEGDVSRLIDEMKKSIQEADEFIASMGT
jgi:hypothetical protein